MTSPPSSIVQTSMLDALLGYHLRRAQSAVFAELMQTLSDDQVTPGQFGVLTLIHENAGLNQSTLANALGIERSTMVGVIDVLEKRGLVARQKSKTDKRAHALALSTEGKRLLKSVVPKVKRHEKDIACTLSADEVKTLVALLRKVAR